MRSNHGKVDMPIVWDTNFVVVGPYIEHSLILEIDVKLTLFKYGL